MAYIRKRILQMRQAEFADALNISQSTVSRWETGALEPSRQEMSAIRALATSKGIEWNDGWFFDEPPSETAEEEEPAETHRQPPADEAAA